MLLKLRPQTFVATLLLVVGQWGAIIFFALTTVDIARAFAFAAVTTAKSGQHQLVGIDRAGGRVFVFDSVTGHVLVTAFPESGE